MFSWTDRIDSTKKNQGDAKEMHCNLQNLIENAKKVQFQKQTKFYDWYVIK